MMGALEGNGGEKSFIEMSPMNNFSRFLALHNESCAAIAKLPFRNYWNLKPGNDFW
jgi:hypothetical protein